MAAVTIRKGNGGRCLTPAEWGRCLIRAEPLVWHRLQIMALLLSLPETSPAYDGPTKMLLIPITMTMTAKQTKTVCDPAISLSSDLIDLQIIKNSWKNSEQRNNKKSELLKIIFVQLLLRSFEFLRMMCQNPWTNNKGPCLKEHK